VPSISAHSQQYFSLPGATSRHLQLAHTMERHILFVEGLNNACVCRRMIE
jgi:hypothetical protein